MKIKKLISSALLIVMVFMAFVAVIPVTASAAQSSYFEESDSITADKAKAIIKKVFEEYQFDTAEEMLVYEKGLGYLDYVTSDDGQFTIYVNRYTGVLYYYNNVTGQLLTSNPYYYSTTNSDTINNQLLSQITISFATIATGENFTYYSSEWAAKRAQIETSYIANGIRVNYTLGDTTARFLLPGRIKADKFEALILRPIIEEYVSLLEEYCGDHEKYSDYNFDVFTNEKYNVEGKEDFQNDIIYYGCINSYALKKFADQDMKKIYTEVLNKNSAEYKKLDEIRKDIISITSAYSVKNVNEYLDESKQKDYETIVKDYYTGSGNLEIYETLEPIYVYIDSEIGKLTENKRKYASVFQKYATGYTLPEMFQDEKECGYVDNSEQKPVFRCALEYTFDADGALSVRLPSSSISFDETVYTLSGITPLIYFGAGDLTRDGYIFYPDGSGTVVEYEDFYNDSDKVRVFLTGTTYGKDYCYSKLTGAHREHISMPVYGVVGEANANASTKLAYGVDQVTNGYFAILEEGASLAKIAYEMGGAQYKYAHAYCSFNPYPSDQYDLSDTISVGGATEYTIVSESRYNGSYVTKYVMLTDPEIGEKLGGNYYATSYVGMANCYRDYLEARGVISALDLVSSDLPLYIEALGSMEIVAKILSFPVNKKIALTAFEDIVTMYKQLSDSAAVFEAKAAEYDALAAEETDEAIKLQYQQTADGYRALIPQVETIDNINFRLNGFANGGLKSTYPTKIRWEKACGGKKAFKELLKEASAVSANNGKNFGIYPDFDFMYINYTESFDGIRIKGNVSRMVDNRYASKQIYSSILMEYTSHFTLVINPEALEDLYTKFAKKYSKYEATGISVSTMGSDLNSNFDEDNPVNRDEAQGYVSNMLNSLKNEQNLDVLLDVGNVYTLQYASHILNASIDSSHFSYSSYAVPFVGMVLHGSVNYAGSPLNYSGTPAYDILRSIESGASLYYILCYQNSKEMKEDALLSDYYGIDYATWYENIVTTYKTLNDAIGDLQSYYITNHQIIKAERIIDASEMDANYVLLLEEFIENLDEYVNDAIDAGYDEIIDRGNIGQNLAVTFDKAALVDAAAAIVDLGVDVTEAKVLTSGVTFGAAIDAIIAKYTSEYPVKDAATDYTVTVNANEYESKYSFLTDSFATDEDYKYTDYTSDIGNVVLVTYTGANGETVQFVLNYNIYSVNIRLESGEIVTLDKYGYQRISK